MKTPFYAGLVLVVTLTIMGLVAYTNHQKSLLQALQATATEQALELAGAKRALEVKPKEVVRFVEVPAAVKEAVKNGSLAPVTAIRIDATTPTLSVPCPEPPSDPGPPGAVEVPRFANIRFGLTGEVFVGKVKSGAVEATVTLKGTVFGDNGFSAPLDFKPEDVALGIVFSKEISRAIEAYQEPWLKKHTAFACPGIGITYNPLNARPVDLALTCGYSLVWF